MDRKGVRVEQDDVGTINRGTWTKQRTLRWFVQFEGWSDPGEEKAIADVAPMVRGKPILDIGVGAGRTVPLMLELSTDYTAVDFAQPMVDACKQKYPDQRIEWADARDLSKFADATFGFVMFSWNGIDAIDHEGRARAFAEIARVLRPGGLFLFSTLNEHGPEARARPWKKSLNEYGGSGRTRALRAVASVPIDMANYMRLRKEREYGDGWSIRSLSSHHFGLVTHYTTLEREMKELADSGFELVGIRENSLGTVVEPGDDSTNAAYWHVIARKAS
jgi:SAM-dependent methyltransferase